MSSICPLCGENIVVLDGLTIGDGGPYKIRHCGIETGWHYEAKDAYSEFARLCWIEIESREDELKNQGEV